MKKQWLTDNLMIAGRSGSGKSYHFEHTILPKLVKNDWRQIIILDMKGQYKFGAIVDINDIENPMHLAEIAIGKHTKRKNGKLRPPRIITIVSRDYHVEQIENIFAYLNRTKNKIFVMEEAAFYFEDLKGRTIPPETKFYIRCSTGPHNKNNNMILITQYPNDVPSTFINMFGKGRIFYLPPKAIDYLCSKYFIADKRDEVLKEISPLGSWKWYDIEKSMKEGLSDGSGKDEQEGT